jgi:transcriptional pleiotropic regulator of transition state genes
MKATGIVRQTDNLGRIVLPIELRRQMGFIEGTPLAIYTSEDAIILKKHESGCSFCGQINDTWHFRGKLICKECVEELSARIKIPFVLRK